jgi:hypothetical protein
MLPSSNQQSIIDLIFKHKWIQLSDFLDLSFWKGRNVGVKSEKMRKSWLKRLVSNNLLLLLNKNTQK